MKRSFIAGVILALISLTAIAAICGQIPQNPATPEWIKYLDIIIPGVTYAFKILIGVIIAMGTLLANIMIYYGKKRVEKLNYISHKVDITYQVITDCKNCRPSVEKVATAHNLLNGD